MKPRKYEEILAKLISDGVAAIAVKVSDLKTVDNAISREKVKALKREPNHPKLKGMKIAFEHSRIEDGEVKDKKDTKVVMRLVPDISVNNL